MPGQPSRFIAASWGRLPSDAAGDESVKHATPVALEALEPLLVELRELEGIVERKNGIFTRKSKAFVHFHEDPEGLFADVRDGLDFARHRVSTQRERRAFLARVRALLQD